MSPAPLPPHERPWRHPSELAPTQDDVDADTPRFTLPLIVGSATMLIVAVLVVAVTPSPSGSEQISLTGSTTPARVTPSADVDTDNDTAASGQSSTAIGDGPVVRLAAFTAIPNAVAATPTFHVGGRRVAGRLPRASESVLVQTEFATYRITWGDVQWLEIDGRAVIADESFALIGYIDDGDFYPLVER